MSGEFGKLIKDKIIGKTVEVYQGETHRTLTGYEDFEHEHKSVLFGKVIDIEGTLMTLEVKRNGKVGQVYVNLWSVKTITVPDSGVSIDDVYWPAPEITHERKK